MLVVGSWYNADLSSASAFLRGSIDGVDSSNDPDTNTQQGWVTWSKSELLTPPDMFTLAENDCVVIVKEAGLYKIYHESNYQCRCQKKCCFSSLFIDQKQNQANSHDGRMCQSRSQTFIQNLQAGSKIKLRIQNCLHGQVNGKNSLSITLVGIARGSTNFSTNLDPGLLPQVPS